MATLYDQPPRQDKSVSMENVSQFLKEVLKLAQEHNIHASDVIDAYKVMELSRQNDLYVANGDAHDEQIAGIGQAIQSIASAIDTLSQRL